MARTPEGWKLGKRKPYHVRFTYQKRRYDLTTGTSEIGAAKKAAARIYADVVSGRLRRANSGALVHPSTDLLELATEWLEDIVSELAENSEGVYETYARHWAEHMPTIGDVVTAKLGDYQRARLASVTRGSVLKERTGFRRFGRWLVEKGYLSELPEFPTLAKKARGTPAKGVRKAPSYVLTEEEVESVLAWSGQDPFFVVCWETGLRPQSTVQRLQAGDLTPFGLVIRPECDKNGWGRTIPVSSRARAALESALPFPKVTRLGRFKRAAEKALGRRDVTIYDLKHARATKWVDEGKPLGGISFLLGVSIETLVERYVHSSRRSAEEVLRCGSGAGARKVKKMAAKDHAALGSGAIAEESSSRNYVVPAEETEPNSATGTGEVVRLHRNGQPWLDPSLPAAVRIALFRRAS